jgi:hypothetical protein
MEQRCCVAAALLLTLCGGVSAVATEPKTGEWKYVMPPPGDPFEHPPLRALALSDAKPADLQEKNTYRGTRRQYGRVHLGSPSSLDVAVVLDHVTATEFDLYLDADRNRVIEPKERVVLQGGAWRATLDVMILDGVKKRPIPRTVIFQLSRLGRMLRFAACGYIEGRTLLGGRECVVRRTDGDGNGFWADPQDRIWIDLDGNGQWDSVEEQFLYAPILVLGGKRYAVRSDLLGERLALDELQGTGGVKLALAPDLAGRSSGVTATLVGRDGFVLSLQLSAGIATIPVGEYRLSAVTIGVRASDGGPAVNYVFSDTNRRQADIWHRVTKDASLVLDPIGKLALGADFGDSKAGFRPGEEFRVQPSFHTGDGLVIATVYRGELATEEDRRSVCGQIKLTKPDGSVLSTYSTGFG